MKTRGILFKPAMVKALLNVHPDVWPAKPIKRSEPSKWQTRRTVEPQPEILSAKAGRREAMIWNGHHSEPDAVIKLIRQQAPYPVGTILYVKEVHYAWGQYVKDGTRRTKKTNKQRYKFRRLGDSVDFTIEPQMVSRNKTELGWHVRLPLFMEARDARVWLKVMKVEVERVNAISEDDALAEGTPIYDEMKNEWPAQEMWTRGYAKLWDSINGKGDFAKGNYVFVYHVARISKPKGSQ